MEVISNKSGDVEETLQNNIDDPSSTPLGKSRYGRTRKPKVSEDFCNIDDIFGEVKPKSPVKAPSPGKRRSAPPNVQSIKKRLMDVSKSPVPVVKDDLHVSSKTYDLSGKVKVKSGVETPPQAEPVKSERKFFKTSSSRTASHHEKNVSAKTATDVNAQNSDTEQLNENVLPVDVTKVLKIVANKPETTDKLDNKVAKPTLRTYGNKRKLLPKNDVIESFGLPDNPIVPITEPKTNVPQKLDRKLDVDVSPVEKINISESAESPAKAWGICNIDLAETDDKDDCTFDEECCADSIFDEVRVKADEAVVKRILKKASKKGDASKADVVNDKKEAIAKRDSLRKEKEKVAKSSLTEKSEDRNKKRSKTDRSSRSKHSERHEKNKVQNKDTVMNHKTSARHDRKPHESTEHKSNASPHKKHRSSKSPSKKPERMHSKVNNVKDTPKSGTPQKYPKESKSSPKKSLKTEEPPKEKPKVSPSKAIKVSPKRLRSSIILVNDKIESVDLTSVEDTDESKDAVQVGGKKLENGLSDTQNCVLLDTSQIKRETSNFEVGDLMWAQIGSHPYWPCLITIEPDLQIFQRKGKRQHTMYHVRFFGDKGRRSWIDAAHIVPFVAENDLEVLLRKAKADNKPQSDLDAYTVKPNKQEKWQTAVQECMSLRHKSPKEREAFFFDMFASKRERKLLGLSANLKLKKIKAEPVDEDYTPRRSYAKLNVQRSRSYTPNIAKHVSKKRRLSEADARADSEADVRAVSKVDVRAVSKAVGEEETPRNLRSGVEVVVKQEGVTSDAEVAVPKVVSFEELEALYKRNNLFKGVSKDRVCQICEKPGDVLRCKGSCNGNYHVKCASSGTDECEVPVGSTTTSLNVTNNPAGTCNGVRKDIVPEIALSTDAEFKKLSLAEQIDLKMKEIMKTVNYDTIYADSTTDDSCSEDNFDAKTDPANAKEIKIVKHVTGDGEFFDTSEINANELMKAKAADPLKSEVPVLPAVEFKCGNCEQNVEPECFVCATSSGGRQKCSMVRCSRYFHPECLKVWPQTQWSFSSAVQTTLDTFVCPMHVCHTCVSDNPQSSSVSRCSSDKIVKCLRCPSTYHTSNLCIPAGTVIASTSQIICPRHVGAINTNKKSPKVLRVINVMWCFICSKGGKLICCETCPTSVHSECLPIALRDDGTFVCEDCESGRFPRYDDVVWVKLGMYRWWPARILFPNEVPENVNGLPHNEGEFVVKFFGTNDHYWVNRGRVFLFEEGDDKGHDGQGKNKVDTAFKAAVAEAIVVHKVRVGFRNSKEVGINNGLKPLPYVRIKGNKPVGNVRLCDGNVSNTTPCSCDPTKPHPCGPESDCINRLLLTECSREVCPAGDRCENQRFSKCEYPPLAPHKTASRGWGLKSLRAIEKGEFVIEYVGEVIDAEEYARRVARMSQQKDENYYFLTIDKDRTIDAGPKGNLARFMNHSCEPNCETQKWTVNGHTRVGLFAVDDIPAETELTFNYNLESIGEEMKVCNCGAAKCSGFIGVKVKQEESRKKYKKKSKFPTKLKNQKEVPAADRCFACGKRGDVGKCNNITCPKFYHLKCVNLTSWPEGKWRCPWHFCNICAKRTIKCCIKCTNSYCPAHSDTNIRFDEEKLGFVCRTHDSSQVSPLNETTTQDTDVTSTTQDDTAATDTSEIAEFDDKTRMNCVTSTPSKKTSDSIDSGDPELPPSAPKRKRGRPRKDGKEPNSKKVKLDEVTSMSCSSKADNNAVFVQKEVKLTGSIPSRHLRKSMKGASEENVSDLERFLKRQLEFEKDLPIRKRSRPRCETTL